MRYLAFFIVITAAIFLYSLMNQKSVNSVDSDSTIVVEDSANWLTDLSVVQAKAQEEEKPILMDFTGSNWCGWCIKLKKEVFSKPAFIEYANEHLILMTVDFPRGVEQEESLVDQNHKLMDKYGVNSFPTIILVDAEGEVLGKTGYLRGGPEAYIDHLKSLLTNSNN
jgi:thioredoxin-related protein